jgi:hypothetical protein
MVNKIQDALFPGLRRVGVFDRAPFGSFFVRVAPLRYKGTSGRSGKVLDMGMKTPTEAEFEVTENEVVHIPTGATWTAYSGHPEPANFRPSMLGSVLHDGDDYRPYEVQAMAQRLLANRTNLKRP